MADIRSVSKTALKPQAIPAVSHEIPKAIRDILEPLKQNMELLTGSSKAITLERYVTLRELARVVPAVNLDGKQYALDTAKDALVPAASAPATPVVAPPTAVNGFNAASGLSTVILTWVKLSYAGHAYVEIYRGSTDDRSKATLLAQAPGEIYADPVGGTNAEYYYWARAVNRAGQQGVWTAAVYAKTELISGQNIADIARAIADGSIDGSKLAPNSVTGQSLAPGAVNTTSFGVGIEPIGTFGALPNPVGYVGPQTVFLNTEKKLYRYTGTAWTAAVPTVDLTGVIETTQLADGAVTTVKLGDAQVSSTKLADGSVITAKIGDLQISTTKLADGSITTPKIGAGAVDLTKFASGIQPVAIVAALPNPAGYTGAKTVLLTTDNKLYRYTGTAWTAAVPTTDLSGQITTTQITDDAITTPKIAAGAVTATEIAANTITAAQIAADTITAGQIAAGAISASEIAAKAITVDKLSVGAYTDNLILNPGAEDGTTGWGLVEAGGATLTAVTTDKTEGSYSFKISPGTVNSAQGCRAIPLVPGDTYIVRVKVRGAAATAAGLYIRMNQAASYPAGDFVTAALRSGLTDFVVNGALTLAWTTYEYTYTVPVGVYWGSLSIYNWNSGQDLFFDEAEVRKQLSGGHLTAGSITATQIAAGAIVTAKLAAGAVTANEIAAATITGAKIAANTITASNIAADTITANQIAAGAISTAELAASAVTADKIAAGTITADRLVIGNFDNILENPGFENGLTGWSASAGFSVDTVNFHSGKQALAGVGDGVIKDCWSSKYYEVVPGEKYYAEAYYKTTADFNGTKNPFFFEFRDANKLTPSWAAVGAHVGAQTAWTLASAVVTVPAGKYFMRGGCSVRNDATLGTAYFDSFYVRRVLTSGIIADAAIITAKIADLAVTNAKIKDLSVSKLTAGTITAALTSTNYLALSSGGNIRSGKTSYTDDATAGFWLGNDGGTPKLSIGNAGHVKGLKWTGSGLEIRGDLIAGTLGRSSYITKGGHLVNASAATPDLYHDVTFTTAAAVTDAGEVAWVNPNNVLVDDTSYATLNLSAQTGGRIQVTGLSAALPSDAVIVGFHVYVRGTSADFLYSSLNTKLIKNGTVVASTSGVTFSTTEGESQAGGGERDLFGETWTPADVNASNFGVDLDPVYAPTTNSWSIDHVRIRIIYQIPVNLDLTDTSDFAASGAGFIADTTNDHDAFIFTGKTATQLTGCYELLAHNAGATVIPGTVNSISIHHELGQTRSVQDRGDGVYEEYGLSLRGPRPVKLEATNWGTQPSVSASGGTLTAVAQGNGTVGYNWSLYQFLATNTLNGYSASTINWHRVGHAAFVTFQGNNGTAAPDIKRSMNFSSLTDNGVGDYTINFAVPFANVYYAPAGMGSAMLTDGRHQLEGNAYRTTSAFRMLTTNAANTLTDSTWATAIFFGN